MEVVLSKHEDDDGPGVERKVVGGCSEASTELMAGP